MRKVILTSALTVLALSACSQEISDEGSIEALQAAEETANDTLVEAEQRQAAQEPLAKLAPVAAPPGPVSADALPNEPQGQASMPDFTYTHEYRFEAAASNIAQIQDAHVAACDKMGQQQCRIANFRQDMDRMTGVEASLELYVASNKIRTLATEMTSIARELDGERIEANIIGTEATQRLDEAQLRVRQNLIQKDRLQAIVDDRRSTRAEKERAREQLVALNATLNANQRQLDQVASDIGFTKMDVSYSSASLFAPLLPYVLILLILAAIAGLVYRSRHARFAEPATA